MKYKKRRMRLKQSEQKRRTSLRLTLILSLSLAASLLGGCSAYNKSYEVETDYVFPSGRLPEGPASPADFGEEHEPGTGSTAFSD